MKQAKLYILLVAILSAILLFACSDDEPVPDNPEDAIKGSTWLVNGELMPSQGITNLELTFDENLNAIAASVTLDGTEETYLEGSVSGKATVEGENVDFEVGFGNVNMVEYNGTLDEGRTSGTGIVSHKIRKDLDGPLPIYMALILTGRLSSSSRRGFSGTRC